MRLLRAGIKRLRRSFNYLANASVGRRWFRGEGDEERINLSECHGSPRHRATMEKQFINIILLGIAFFLIFTSFQTGSMIQVMFW